MLDRAVDGVGMKRRALVTGGAGFIGSHLCEALVCCGYRVTALDDLSTGDERNLGGLLGNESFSFVCGDVTDFDLLKGLVDDCDVVFHLAALVSVPLSMENSREYYRVNAGAFGDLLDLARGKRVPVLYASSAATYGEPVEGGRQCESAVLRPCSPYGASKVINEIQAATAWRAWGVPTVGFRFFNVYGPRQSLGGSYASVVPKFCYALLHGQRPVVYGDGGQTRDFVHVKDVARVLIAAYERVGELAGQVFNVGSGEVVSINDLLDILAERLGFYPEVERREPRIGDIRHSNADISAIMGRLEGLVMRGLREGVEDTLEWYRDV